MSTQLYLSFMRLNLIIFETLTGNLMPTPLKNTNAKSPWKWWRDGRKHLKKSHIFLVSLSIMKGRIKFLSNPRYPHPKRSESASTHS